MTNKNNILITYHVREIRSRRCGPYSEVYVRRHSLKLKTTLHLVEFSEVVMEFGKSLNKYII